MAVGLAASGPSPPIAGHITHTWATLTRSTQALSRAAGAPQFHVGPSGRRPGYLARTENAEQVERDLRAQMPPEDFGKIEIRSLPEDFARIREQGLLYLPRPYVVPGGRFNEMYGWDSYFIQLGLLKDGEIGLAQDMADNFLYEIRNYGKILNATRTYYLTRSQPPFLTQMVLAVYQRTHDRRWLE